MMEPLEFVLRSDEVIPLMAKFVVVPLRPEKFWSVVEPTTRRSPTELKVEVAVPPKAAVAYTLNCEVEALANCWSAEKVLA